MTASDVDVDSYTWDVFVSHAECHPFVATLRECFQRNGIRACTVHDQQEGTVQDSKLKVVIVNDAYLASERCLNELGQIMNSLRIEDIDHPIVLPVFYDVKPTQLRKLNDEALDQLSRITGISKNQTNNNVGELADAVLLCIQNELHRQRSLRMPSQIDPPSLNTQLMEQVENALSKLSNNKNKAHRLGLQSNHQHIRTYMATHIYNSRRSKFEASCILLGVGTRLKHNTVSIEDLQVDMLKQLANEKDANITHVDLGLVKLRERLKQIKCLIIIDDICEDDNQLRGLAFKNNESYLTPGSQMILTSGFNQALTKASLDNEIVDLNSITQKYEKQILIRLLYHGGDVHHGFVNHLKESFGMLGLSNVSLHNMVDQYSQQTGGTTIVGAEVFILIISKKFLTSPKCLDKLASTFDQIDGEVASSVISIASIFYGINVDELMNHNLNMDVAISNISIDRWKKALEKISNLRHDAQFHVKFDENPSRETKLSQLKNMVSRMTKDLLKQETRISLVTGFPVGLLERQRKLENILEVGEPINFKVVGITGMGGVGKTTLLKSLFNKFHSRFEGAAMILDIREKAKHPKGLISLQLDIIKQAIDRPIGLISSVEEGKIALSRYLAGTNVLLVLDDVDHETQIEALYSHTLLGPGSRIIISSRYKHIFRNLVESEKDVYDVNFLNDDEATMLFLWHAFARPEPPLELKNVVENVIQSCQGLPLSLEVFGSLLSHYNTVFEWEDILNKMHQSSNTKDESDKQLFNKLRITVDKLDPNERMAFLDIACFLIGKSKKTVVRFWRGCGWAALPYLEVLQNMSLLKIDPQDGRIVMHDQLRDLGQYIVKENTSLEMRTHIWDTNDMEMFDTSCSTIADLPKLQGLSWVNIGDKENNVSCSFGTRLTNLRLLFLQKNNIIDHVSTQMSFLQWHECELEYLPQKIKYSRLTVLDLSKSENLKRLWISDVENNLESLLELNLHGCKSFQELEPFNLPKLQWLDMSGCEELKELHTSIGSLTSLEYLDLTNCNKLSSIPQEITDVLKLKMLSLNGCISIREIPKNIGSLRNLEKLLLERTKILELPSSIGGLEKLQELHMSHCSCLIKVPPSIGDLKNLRIWHISGCEDLKELPNEVSKLANLKEFKLNNCGKLSRIPENIGNLRQLKNFELGSNISLSELPDSIGNLSNMEKLNLGGCGLRDGGMPRKLNYLKCLEILYLDYNHNLTKIPKSFMDLQVLKELKIHHCSELMEARYFPTTLRVLDMGDCRKLKVIFGLESLQDLEILELCNCHQLEDLGDIHGLKSLVSLNVSGCIKLMKVRDLHTLKSLKDLCLSGSSLILSRKNLFEEMSNVDHITLYGSKLPKWFKNYETPQKVEAVEHANCEVLKLHRVKNMKIHAILLCFISHDQGWSDFPYDHGRYIQSPTFMEATVRRNGYPVCQDLLYRNRHADSRDQVHFVILRSTHPLIENFKENDTLQFNARSVYQAWRITLTLVGVVLVENDNNLRSYLEDIRRDACFLTLEWNDRLHTNMVEKENAIVKLGWLNMISGREELKELHMDIDSLKTFEYLDLMHYKDLSMVIVHQDTDFMALKNIVQNSRTSEIIENIWRLRNPELSLKNTQILKLPSHVGSLRRLKELWMSHCSMLVQAHPSIGGLHNLQVWHISHCANLEELPDEVNKLSNLEEFILHNCENFSRIPKNYQPTWEKFCSLEVLKMHHSNELIEARFFPKTLRVLDMGDCKNQKVVSSLGSLKQLQVLELCNCYQLEELHDVHALINLESLDVSGCRRLMLPNGLPTLKSMKTLYLSGSGLLLSTENQLWEMSTVDHITLLGSEMPKCFQTLEIPQNANTELFILEICKNLPIHAILLCMVSHYGGWSNFPNYHEMYNISPAFVEATIKREDQMVRQEILYSDQHANSRDQVHFIILRPTHPLIENLHENDILQVIAGPMSPDWGITLKFFGVVLVKDDDQLRTNLEDIRMSSCWLA